MELTVFTWEMISKGQRTCPGFTTRRFAGLELFQSLPVFEGVGCMLYGLTWELKLETYFVGEQKSLGTAGPGEGPGDES